MLLSATLPHSNKWIAPFAALLLYMRVMRALTYVGYLVFRAAGSRLLSFNLKSQQWFVDYGLCNKV